jgi:hypothetical protein
VPAVELRSPVARAVLPVLGGIVVLALIAGFTWAMAAFISRGGADSSDRFTPTTFKVGEVESMAAKVATDGPLLFPELGREIGTRSVVVNHTGDSPTDNWQIYWAYPADRAPECVVDQIPKTSTFTDCDGRTIDVTDLAPPDPGVFPTVVERRYLVLDVRGAVDTSSTGG